MPWLRTGEGEMFKPPVKPAGEDEQKLLELFRHLSPKMRAFVLQIIQEYLRIDEEPLAKTEEASQDQLR